MENLYMGQKFMVWFIRVLSQLICPNRLSKWVKNLELKETNRVSRLAKIFFFFWHIKNQEYLNKGKM